MWSDVDTVDRAGVTRCDHCGLRSIACVCRCLEAIELPFLLTIIIHRNELRRPTSTSRFLKLSSNTQLIEFSRKTPLNLPSGSRLLFPDLDSLSHSNDQSASLPAMCDDAGDHDSVNFDHLVVLDGTWGECRKMLRQSPVLQGMQRLTIVSSRKSSYPFRKNQLPGGLSTAEAVAEVANQYFECSQLQDQLMHFFDHASASQNGHSLPC